MQVRLHGNAKHFVAVRWERIHSSETGVDWYIVDREPKSNVEILLSHTHTQAHTKTESDLRSINISTWKFKVVHISVQVGSANFEIDRKKSDKRLLHSAKSQNPPRPSHDLIHTT